MKKWLYDSARDVDQAPTEGLRQFPREPDMVIYGLRSLGALAVAMILPWLLRFSLPSFGPWQLILSGLIVGIGGQLGDLSVSVIKRDIGTKDMAATIPGHGGILDRIDSLAYTAPLFMHMATYYYPLR